MPARFSTARAGTLALLLAIAGCGEPAGPAFEPSPAVRAAPRLQLTETAALRARLVGVEPAAERLAAERDALTARAEALRARAAALGAPVVAPERRSRLLEAAGGESL